VILWVIGMVGFVMRVVGVPIVPCVLGLILGPLVEQQLRRSLAISQGDWTVFVAHPVSAVFLLVALAFIATPIISGLRRRKRQSAVGPIH
jgi:putative tricarboxylic transport membrane protein